MLEIKRFASFLFFWLPLVRSSYTPCSLCVDRATPSILAAMELRLYTSPILDNYTSVRIDHASKLLDEMDSSKPTVVYIHGWGSSPDSPSAQAVISAYLSRRDHNVVLLNWQTIAGKFPLYSVVSTKGVGFTLANALNELVLGGLSTGGLHVVGHSLGAQIAGYTGRYLNFRLSRITGLDPAGFGFYGNPERLSSSDADFVVSINTDVYFYGINVHLADVDFYPNGGFRPQPGCPDIGFLLSDEDFCSHVKAVYYYAESVLNETAFPSVKCGSYLEFENGVCSTNEMTVMGFATPTTASGKFYLHTNGYHVRD